MGWLHTDDIVQFLTDKILLYDLSRINGTSSVLSRIPQDWGGVYAWYRRFKFDKTKIHDPEVFSNFILEELYKNHSATRECRLPPSHNIKLEPKTFFAKEAILKELSQDESFRRALIEILENSIIFQQPLYIGKSKNLFNRINLIYRRTAS